MFAVALLRRAAEPLTGQRSPGQRCRCSDPRPDPSTECSPMLLTDAQASYPDVSAGFSMFPPSSDFAFWDGVNPRPPSSRCAFIHGISAGVTPRTVNASFTLCLQFLSTGQDWRGLLSEFEGFEYGSYLPTVLANRGQHLCPGRVHRGTRRAFSQDRWSRRIRSTRVVRRRIRRTEDGLHSTERDGLATVRRDARLPAELVVDRQRTEALKQPSLKGDKLTFNGQATSTPGLRGDVVLLRSGVLAP